MRLLGNLISCFRGAEVREERATPRCLALQSPDAERRQMSSCITTVDPSTEEAREASQTTSSSTGLLSPSKLGIFVPACSNQRPYGPFSHLKLVPSLSDLLDGIALENIEPCCGPGSVVWKGVLRGAKCNLKFLQASHLTPDLLHGIDVLCTQSHPFILQYYHARAVRIVPDMWTRRSQDGVVANVRVPHDFAVEAQSLGTESLLGSALYDTFEDEQGMLGMDAMVEAVRERLQPTIDDYIIVLIAELCILGDVRRAIQGQCFQASRHWSKQLGTRAALCTVREVALGLLHLHLLGAAHGNLRPSQVLLMESRADQRGFTAKVADTGLGPRHTVLPSSGSKAGQEAAAFRYTAPELLCADAVRTPSVAELQAADVYSFGCLLYELLTSAPPYSSFSRDQLLAALVNGSVALDWPPDCEPGLRRLCCRCVHLNPTERPSFATVLSELNAIEAVLRSSRSAAVGTPAGCALVEHLPAVGGAAVPTVPAGSGGGGACSAAVFDTPAAGGMPEHTDARAAVATATAAAAAAAVWERGGGMEGAVQGDGRDVRGQEGREGGEEPGRLQSRSAQQLHGDGGGVAGWATPMSMWRKGLHCQGQTQGQTQGQHPQLQQQHCINQRQQESAQVVWVSDLPQRFLAIKEPGPTVSEAFSSVLRPGSCLYGLGGFTGEVEMLEEPHGRAVIDLDAL